MSHLMSQCKYTVQIVGIVQKHIRMSAVSAPGIRTASLVLILIYIYPAALHASLKCVDILIAHRLKCLCHKLFRLIIGVGGLYIVHNRCKQIIHVQMLHTKKLLPKRHVPVQSRQMCVNRLNQIVIDTLRDITTG